MKRWFLVLVVLVAAAIPAVNGQVRPNLLGIGQPPTVATGADAFFDDTVLHEIRLEINSRDWETLKANFQDNTYYPADFRWKDQVVRNIGIRSRGAGSRSGVKPGLRIDFDHYSDLRFLGLKSVVLRNNTQDASNMRERIAMLLFRRLGLLASREAHARIVVDGQYAGLYTIVESIDKDFLTRNLNENDGHLYEFRPPAQQYFFDDLGGSPGLYVPAPFEPETHKSDPQGEFIVDLVRTLNTVSDASFRTVMAEYVDLRKFVRHIAVEKFLADYDSIVGDFGMNNFYFYRFQNTKLFTFIAWDKSYALSDATHSIFRNISEGPAHTNKLMTRALNSRDLYDLYLDALLECAAAFDDTGATGGQRWIDREIDREYSQIRDAVYSDPQKNYTNEQFEGEVSKLRDFGRARPGFVTAAVATGRTQGPPR